MDDNRWSRPQTDVTPEVLGKLGLRKPLDTLSAITLNDGSLQTDLMCMGHTRQRECLGPRRRSIDGDEGIDFVRCRICGDHRRVISGRHLSKHDTDRETYMREYDLSPDELIAKA